MMTISWSFPIQDILVDGSIDAEAVDRIDVEIKPGDKDKIVDLQPGGKDSILLLLVTSTSYGEHLSFKANDGKDDSAHKIDLTGPQFFSGGCIRLFDKAPKILKFTNDKTPNLPATVRILVARDATPKA